jgi:SAM-dependent methyltransferase
MVEQTQKKIKINLGGGRTKMDGFVNIDVLDFPEVDIVHDLNKGIPLEDNSVSEVYSSHTLEHLDDIVSIVKEMYRVCEDGAKITIKVPYFKSIGAFKDPTHKQFFTDKTFDYFDKANIENGSLPDYQLAINLKVEKIYFMWHRHRRVCVFEPVLRILNKFVWNMAHTIIYELRVVK